MACHHCKEIQCWRYTVLCLATQSCLTLCDPVDCSLSGSSVRGMLQARTLEWVAMPSSRGSSQTRDQTQVPCIAGGSLPCELPEKPKRTRTGSYPFPRGASQPRNQTGVSCTASNSLPTELPGKPLVLASCVQTLTLPFARQML